MLDVTSRPSPDHSAPALQDAATASAERSAFSDASEALQRHRPPSPIWGDESEAEIGRAHV